MSIPGAGSRPAKAQIRRFLLPGVVWAAALFTAPFLNHDGGVALVWGTGAAVLVSLFPWALVTMLDMRGDLRRGMGRLGAPPIILGAAGASFMVLRAIRWADGPMALAAVIFAMIAAYVLTMGFAKVVPLNWEDVTYAAAAVILPVVFLLVIPGAVGAAVAGIAAIVFVAALLSARHGPASQSAGSIVVGLLSSGLFVFLL